MSAHILELRNEHAKVIQEFEEKIQKVRKEKEFV